MSSAITIHRVRDCSRVTLIRIVLAFASVAALAPEAFAGSPEPVVPNDNTRSAGTVDGSTVTIRLRAATGSWQPEGPSGPALMVDAFGEEGAALSVPAPLIRVVEGVTVVVSLRNELEVPLRVHGLCERNGDPCAPLVVPPREHRQVQFASGRPGTYHYWATSLGAPMPFRELAGALVVDTAGETPQPDRIFVITEWTSLTAADLRELFTADDVTARFVGMNPRLTFVINGLSWPATERLSYDRGANVRWRIINLSSQVHPMHLHGFYFTVVRTGDGSRDDPAGQGKGLRAVTHPVPSGGTLLLDWIPEREGNWLFHCHVMHHVSAARRLDAATTDVHGSHASHHATAGDAGFGMAGMVLGVTVRGSTGTPDDPPATHESRRRLSMTIARAPQDGSIGVSIVDGATAGPEDRLQSPGPALVLRRGQPVEIQVHNGLAEPTSIHWHGLELESYYDGVHGWSGMTGRIAPMIQAGGSFVVRLTPPRAGTFIYHTHVHDYQQLSAGLYGALVVTEPDETYDPATDHVILLGRRDATEVSSILQDASSLVVNGERTPRWRWAAGKRHRIRLINITPDDVLSVALLKGDAPVTWRLVAKDGAAIAAGDSREAPARLPIAVGETYDFVYDAPAGRTQLWLDVRTTSGKWQAQGGVVVR